MSRNQEIAQDLRDWREELVASQKDSDAKLARARALSERYGRYSNDPKNDPFARVMEQETQRGVELGKAITSTETLISLADQEKLVDPSL